VGGKKVIKKLSPERKSREKNLGGKKRPKREKNNTDQVN
jgi:hypothetical protein